MFSRCALISAQIAMILGVQLSAVSTAKADDTVYVVDMDRVISDSIIGKAARNTIEEEVKKKKAGLEKAQAELKKMKDDLDKQASVLFGDALQSKRDAFERRNRDFQRDYQDDSQEIGRKNQQEIAKVVKQVAATVKSLGEKNNYKIILERDQRVVLYVNEKYDITDQVIKMLNDEKVNM